MSHEVPTPLNGVTGMATRLELDPQPFDLEVLAREVTELLAAAAESKGLRLVLRLAPGTARHLLGDSLRLRQVLINLLGNAVKFTEDGHVLLDIEGIADPLAAGDRVRVRFTVEDTGIGIPSDRLENTFEAFTQADASTTRRHGGSGLGLTISRRLVRLLGGELAVASAVGKGSRFWFEVELDSPVEPAAAAFDPGIRGARVLVVDDVPLHSRVLLEQLRRWRLAVTAVTDESSACEAARRARHSGDAFRLAVINHRGGALDGAALAVRLAEDAGTDPPPQVILLAPIAPCTPVDLLERGHVAACLQRPTTPSELLDSLTATWLVGFTARQQAEPRATSPRVAYAPPLPAGSSLAVLVAEDSEISRRVAVRHLEKLGCRVETTTNGADAVRRIQEHAFDLVFMDCQMPVMDGFEATARIRELAGPAASVPIVALTAHATSGDRERCLAAGMSDYLPKPLEPAALAGIVQRYAKTAHAAIGAAEPRAFDRERLFETVDRDQDLLCELVSLVNGHAPSVLDAIAAAVRAGRGPDVAAKAHELRGMLLNVHAASAAEWARRLELAADTGRSDEWPALLAGVREETERVLGEADRFLAEAPLEPKDPPLRRASAG